MSRTLLQVTTVEGVHREQHGRSPPGGRSPPSAGRPRPCADRGGMPPAGSQALTVTGDLTAPGGDRSIVKEHLPGVITAKYDQR